jgi:hypothetical protein
VGRNLNIGSRGPRVSIEERFWRKAVRLGDDVCWPWHGAHTRLGYAHFWDGTYTPAGYARMVEAHRWAFKHFVKDPGSLDVLHSCDVYDCTNFIRHLRAGTKAENMGDRDSRGRGVVPDMRGFVRGSGSRFTAEQVREMRADYRGARGDIQRLAEKYGVGHQTISNIIRGRSWVE